MAFYVCLSVCYLQHVQCFIYTFSYEYILVTIWKKKKIGLTLKNNIIYGKKRNGYPFLTKAALVTRDIY